MATSNDNRTRKRSPSRSKTARKSALTKTRGSARDPKPAHVSIARQQHFVSISSITTLRRAVAVAASAALEKQNADIDADIALALRCGVIDPLTDQIERYELLLGGEASDEG